MNLFSLQRAMLAFFTILSLLLFYPEREIANKTPNCQNTLVAHNHAHGNNHISGSSFCSVMPYPDPITLTQPDGRTFEAMYVVEEAIVYLETMDGFSILMDKSDDYFKYAVTGLDGELFLSGTTVSAIAERNASESLLVTAVVLPHLRFTGKAKTKRNEAQASKNINEPGNTGVFPPTGTQKALLILIDFPDLAQTYSVAEFENLCNQVGYNVNGQTGSFRDYYLDVSNGLLTVNTDVVGWYTADNPRATYGIEDMDDRNFENAVPLMREAVDFAEAVGIDFSEYDGDGDGRVDVVEVIHAGRGAEESGNVDDIWSHRWVLAGDGLSVTYDGVLVNDYITQAEKLGATDIANIGVFVHEFGHALGLPDLYDTDGGSSGLGRWCLMAGGTWNNGGKTPAHPAAWCKDQLGWTTTTTLSGSGSITDMDFVDNADQIYRLNTPLPDQYFLIENRQQVGWDANIPGEGLTIYHIDEGQGGNQDHTRYKVDLEQADGLQDLNNNSDSGDAGDPFPGSTGNPAFTCATTPNSDVYEGTGTDISLTNISISGNLASFNYGACAVGCTVLGITDAGTGISNHSGGTYDYEIIVSYLTPPALGTLDITAAGETFNVAIGTSPQTINLTGLPATGNEVTVTATFSEDAACTATTTDLFTAAEDCLNDDVCDAYDLTSRIDGPSVLCTNVGMTVQINEPSPQAVACNVQNGWCGNEANISATVWYKFTAPASGSIDIDFETNIDMQMAVWEADDCADILNASARMMVAANDDDGSAGGYSPRIENLRCLIPGKVYYVQVDGFDTNEGSFAISITDPELSCSVAPTATAGCETDHTATSQGYGEWIHIADANGNIVASVNDKLNNLGAITANYAIHSGEAREDGESTPYLNRDWLVSVANNNPACIRFYFTDAEFQNLVDAGGPSDLLDYKVTKFDGGTCGEFSSSSSLISVSHHKSDFAGSTQMIEFEVSGFSSFFGHGGAAPLVAAILPVEFESFTGKTMDRHNLLKWVTASEQNTKIHQVERLNTNTQQWETIGEQAAAISSRANVEYRFNDQNPLLKSYYRIKTVDFDGAFEYSEVLFLEQQISTLTLMNVYPIPAKNNLQIAFASPNEQLVQYMLKDLTGRTIYQNQMQANTTDNFINMDLTNVKSGAYILVIQNETEQLIQKIIKQ